MRHRISKFLSMVARALISSVLRTAFTTIIFVVSSLITMKYLGIPIPGPHEIINKFEGVARLADILS